MIYSILFLILNIVYANIVQYGGELYIDGNNARNLGMGGYSVSYSIGSNPARAMPLSNSKISLSYKNKYFDLVNINLLSYCFFKEIKGTSYPVYMTVINRQISDIPDTRSAINIDGSINYSAINYFSQKEIGLVIGTGYSKKKINLGFNIKPFYSSLVEYKSWGISSDIGLLIKKYKNFELGCWIYNLFSFHYWNTGRREFFLPTFLASSQFELNSMKIGIEVGSLLGTNPVIKYRSGFELFNKEGIFFRGGFSNEDEINCGIGLNNEYFQFNYAYVHPINSNPFKPSHMIDFSVIIKKIVDLRGKLSP